FHLGPDAESYIYNRHSDLIFGCCAITALGKYDSKRGGHLVLWDLGLDVEFPVVRTTFISAGMLRYS
ncbi:hypothetical protein NEOLEDRAFT_1039008, partial [Neolentinus lepideus HHB14362 ss-1]